MTTATHDEILRLFPGIADRAILEIQAMNATHADLEAALLLLQGDDKALLDYKQQEAAHLNELLEVLADWEALPVDDVDR